MRFASRKLKLERRDHPRDRRFSLSLSKLKICSLRNANVYTSVVRFILADKTSRLARISRFQLLRSPLFRDYRRKQLTKRDWRIVIARPSSETSRYPHASRVIESRNSRNAHLRQHRDRADSLGELSEFCLCKSNGDIDSNER